MPLQSRPSVTGPSPIRITRSTVFRGRSVEVGEEFHDATGPEASNLIACGKAVRISSPAAKPQDEPRRSLGEGAPVETAAVEPRTETAARPSQSKIQNRKSKS